MASRYEVTHCRNHFYIGGEYVETATGHILQNQMYVERLTPCGGSKHPFPIIFIHGGGQSGTNWLNKPDGGQGWASWFLDHGHEVYIVDQPHVGRSAWNPKSEHPLVSFSVEFIQKRFTAPARYSLWPQAQLHTQWPGTGMMGDPIFDAYFASTLPAFSYSPEQERALQDAGIALLDKVGPSVLITHSQGALAGWSWPDARPQLVKAVVQIEPKGPPFREAIFSDAFTRPWGLTSIPLTYDPPPIPSSGLSWKKVRSGSRIVSEFLVQVEPARKLVNLAKIPFLIVTGEASYHASYDHSFMQFLCQAGCHLVDHLELERAGIHGNGHLMFLERNSDEVAAEIERWILRSIEPT